MLNENLNNDFHWKSKLEELESLPGETYNKEASWEKLHERMQGKRSNKKAIWYWAAAACLLFALFMPWIFSKENENTLVKNNSEQKQIQTPTSHLMPANNKDSIAVISSPPVEKKLPVNPVESAIKIITPVDHTSLTFENAAIKKDKEEFIEPKINNNGLPLLDTQINIIAIVPEKKKLRVVHINELGDPVEESSAMARKTEIHSFQLKLANQEVFVNPSVASGKTGFILLKTKNSPN